MVRFIRLLFSRLEPRFASTVEPLWVGKMIALLGDILFQADASGLGGEAEVERGLFFGLRGAGDVFSPRLGGLR